MFGLALDRQFREGSLAPRMLSYGVDVRTVPRPRSVWRATIGPGAWLTPRSRPHSTLAFARIYCRSAMARNSAIVPNRNAKYAQFERYARL